MSADTPVPSSPAQRAVPALRRIAVVALLSVILGLAVQSAVLGIKLAGRPPGTDLVVDLASGIAWSLLVCTGLAIGLTIAKGRPLLTGTLAFCFAPAALATAKASQKVLTDWLDAAERQAVLGIGTVSLLRAAEYALLGWLLARLVVRDEDRPWSYLGAGCAAGLIFGGAITGLTWRAASHGGAPLAAPVLGATVINEMVFPVGCALVIFFGQFVGHHVKVLDAGPT